MGFPLIGDGTGEDRACGGVEVWIKRFKSQLGYLLTILFELYLATGTDGDHNVAEDSTGVLRRAVEGLPSGTCR